MNYLHYEFDMAADDVVEVELANQANVRLMDEANWQLYQQGKNHRYHGGYAKESPVWIPAPSAGHWHVVVDLGGYGGVLQATARVLQEAS